MRIAGHEITGDKVLDWIIIIVMCVMLVGCIGGGFFVEREIPETKPIPVIIVDQVNDSKCTCN